MNVRVRGEGHLGSLAPFPGAFLSVLLLQAPLGAAAGVCLLVWKQPDSNTIDRGEISKVRHCIPALYFSPSS
jgi:hypothetical protein